MVRERARVHGFLKIDRDGVPRALCAPRVGDTYHPNQSTSKTADRTFPMVVYPGYCHLLDVVGLAVLVYGCQTFNTPRCLLGGCTAPLKGTSRPNPALSHPWVLRHLSAVLIEP